MQGDGIGGRFHAPRKVKSTPEAENKAVFKLEISLRHPEANTLYRRLAKLEVRVLACFGFGFSQAVPRWSPGSLQAL